MTPRQKYLLATARELASADPRFAVVGDLANMAEETLYRCDALAVKVARRDAELAAHNKVIETAQVVDAAITETLGEGTIYRITPGGTKQKLLGLPAQDALREALAAIGRG